jgi:hypothetical protein
MKWRILEGNRGHTFNNAPLGKIRRQVGSYNYVQQDNREKNSLKYASIKHLIIVYAKLHPKIA